MHGEGGYNYNYWRHLLFESALVLFREGINIPEFVRCCSTQNINYNYSRSVIEDSTVLIIIILVSSVIVESAFVL